MSLKKKPKLHTDWIDPFAKEIIVALQRAGHPAYLVGGCVRDLLAGIPPKDFDIATSALPAEVRKRVRNSYIIGRRFKLVLAKRGTHLYEIATFRREALPEELEAEDAAFGDNFFGTLEDDAFRRDFTINSLFYDPTSDQLIDHCQGVTDVQAGIIRMIGDPTKRIQEDPIRILRAIRLSHKLGFRIEESLRKAIFENKETLLKSALPRRREEWLKILRLNDPYLCFQDLYDLGIIDTILPGLSQIFHDEEMKKIFHFYLKRIKYSLLDNSQPLELFAAFTLAVLFSVYDETQINPEVFTSPALEQLLKDELGVFKAEVAAIERAVMLFPMMKNIEVHKRKGERRRNSFIQSESSYLAFKLLDFTHQFSGQEYYYWQTFFLS